jgi:hypothetical protein
MVLFGLDMLCGGNTKLDKEEIDEINAELNCLYHLQKTGRLDTFIKSQKDTRVNPLSQMQRHLSNLIAVLQNMNYKYYANENEKDNFTISKSLNHANIHRLKIEILTNLIGAIKTLYTLTQDDNLTAKDVRELVEHISGNMLWMLDKGYKKLIIGEMDSEELDDFLKRRALCRVYEEPLLLMNAFYIDMWYRDFAKKEKETE